MCLDFWAPAACIVLSKSEYNLKGFVWVTVWAGVGGRWGAWVWEQLRQQGDCLDNPDL